MCIRDRVTAVLAERGQVLAAGTPVVQLAQDGARDVVFSVPEDKVASLKPGAAVMLRVWSGGRVLTGQVREMAASADPVTRTFLVKAALDSKETLALGTTVTVLPATPQYAGAQAIKLPTSALRQEGQGTACLLYTSRCV